MSTCIILVLVLIDIMITVIIILTGGMIGGIFQMNSRKEKSHTFDGDVKKLEDAEAWILGMKKLFEFHEYTDNMKAQINYI